MGFWGKASDTVDPLGPKESSADIIDPAREISIDMTTDERSAMLDEPDINQRILSPAARAALWSAAPHPGGVPSSWLTCSIEVARELQTWAKAGMDRWKVADPAKSVIFRSAARQIRFALWKVGAGPAP